MRYFPELRSSRPATGTAILLVNLGTPEAPTASAVRRYLRQFLSDPRVIELPRAIWMPLLYGLVLTTRPKRSALKYASIWSGEGSPLKVHTDRQAQLLLQKFESRNLDRIGVDFAMRYGEPSIQKVLLRLKSEGYERILVFPLYPQYAASTTASVLDEVALFMQRTRNIPEIRTVKHFPDNRQYIHALAKLVREHRQASGPADKLIMSFHGLPRNMVTRGDPYRDECELTARLLAKELGLTEKEWQIAFQSRFGRTEWLGPDTASTLADCGRQSLHHVDVLCPGFVSDCLETLEEIGIEGRQTFLGNGGKEFHLLPCLNQGEAWIGAMEAIAQDHLSGWLASHEKRGPEPIPSRDRIPVREENIGR
jgi:ferrochelatase